MHNRYKYMELYIHVVTFVPSVSCLSAHWALEGRLFPIKADWAPGGPAFYCWGRITFHGDMYSSLCVSVCVFPVSVVKPCHFLSQTLLTSGLVPLAANTREANGKEFGFPAADVQRYFYSTAKGQRYKMFLLYRIT